MAAAIAHAGNRPQPKTPPSDERPRPVAPVVEKPYQVPLLLKALRRALAARRWLTGQLSHR